MEKVQTENKDYIRDTHSRALLAHNINDLHTHRERKSKALGAAYEFQQLKDDVHSLKDAVILLNKSLKEQSDVSKRSSN